MSNCSIKTIGIMIMTSIYVLAVAGIFHPICPGKDGQDSPHRKGEVQPKRQSLCELSGN